MPLLSEIQKDALSPSLHVSDLLRKCKVLARRLKSEDLEKWADNELNGYPPEVEDAPKYRVVEHTTIKADFNFPYGQYAQNETVAFEHIKRAFPNNWNDFTKPVIVRQSISECESAIMPDTRGNQGTLRTLWSPELASKLSYLVYTGCQCSAAWNEVPRAKVVSLIDSVKTKVLEFAMDIEAENPDAGEAGFNETPIPPQTVSNIFHNRIQGGVGNLAQGSHDFEQNATVAPVTQQLNVNWTALSEQLPRLRERLLVTATTSEDYESISGVVEATEAIEAKDESKLIGGLKKGGAIALDVAKAAGTEYVATIMARLIGNI